METDSSSPSVDHAATPPAVSIRLESTPPWIAGRRGIADQLAAHGKPENAAPLGNGLAAHARAGG